MSIQIFFPKNRKSSPPSRNTNGRERALNTFTQNSNKTLTESQELGILTLYQHVANFSMCPNSEPPGIFYYVEVKISCLLEVTVIYYHVQFFLFLDQ